MQKFKVQDYSCDRAAVRIGDIMGSSTHCWRASFVSYSLDKTRWRQYLKLVLTVWKEQRRQERFKEENKNKNTELIDCVFSLFVCLVNKALVKRNKNNLFFFLIKWKKIRSVFVCYNIMSSTMSWKETDTRDPIPDYGMHWTDTKQIGKLLSVK